MIEEALRWLEAQQDKMESDLVEMANQNSGSHNLPGLSSMAGWLEDWMDLPETSFQRINLPPRETVSDQGQEGTAETGPALRWDFRAHSRRRVLLAIHYDTVFGADHEFQTCRRLSADRIGGPGVADAKGGIVVLRTALQALTEFSLAGECGWTVLLNPDEELGSPCSTGLLHEVAGEFDFGLLFEPALPTGELVSGRKGSGNFTIVVRGKSAHAGRHFEDGRNAVAMLSRLMVGLDDLNGRQAGTTINVGRVHGGGPVNVVPDLAVGRLNVRAQDDQGVAWFEKQLQQLVDQVNAQEGFGCLCYGGISSPPKPVTDQLQQLMRALEYSVAQVGRDSVRWRTTGGVCDGNKLAAAGLPNIDTLGPIGGGLHGSSEWVQSSSLVPKAQVVLHLISRFASGHCPELQRRRPA